MQRYERLWERLLTLLETLGEVDSTSDGHLHLTVERHQIEIVMTERDWGDLVGIPYGSFVGAASHLLHMVGRAQSDALPYLVYDTYELHPSATPEPPMQAELEADRRRVQAFLDAHPGAHVEVRAFSPEGDESS